MLTNKGTGGNEVPVDASGAILEIAPDHTLVAQKLSAEDPVKPELAKGLNTTNKVLKHSEPTLKVNFKDGEGVIKVKELVFKELGDFGTKGITTQSAFLTGLATEKDQYQRIIRQLKTNKLLKVALEDPSAKKALQSTLEALTAELN